MKLNNIFYVNSVMCKNEKNFETCCCCCYCNESGAKACILHLIYEKKEWKTMKHAPIQYRLDLKTIVEKEYGPNKKNRSFPFDVRSSKSEFVGSIEINQYRYIESDEKQCPLLIEHTHIRNALIVTGKYSEVEHDRNIFVPYAHFANETV